MRLSREYAVTLRETHPGQPPLLGVDNNRPYLVEAPVSWASRVSHPLPLGGGRGVFIAEQGDLVLWHGTERHRLRLDALVDGRLITDGSGRILLLTGSTDRYSHGVLGDSLEAGSVSLVDARSVLEPMVTFDMPGALVVEGTSPMWTDVDGDGEREIIVTASDEAAGARVLVFDGRGRQRAEGPPVGRGNRWRHQIAVADFGAGHPELATVLTPHIGGIIEFYRMEGSELIPSAGLAGYSSHQIRSRNLDMALAGDFDGDGITELLVPTQDYTELAAVRHEEAGPVAAWQVPLGGRLTTNLAGVAFPDGGLGVGAATEEGLLRLWLP